MTQATGELPDPCFVDFGIDLNMRLAVLNVGSAPGRLLFRFLQSDGSVLRHYVQLPQNRRITLATKCWPA